ncbi:MAG: hypothetical protein DCF19_18280 [Pseudanabaena frigida]|uniref:Uncharacterized protein n=1 Tax=Pseudanabaena frigida TaxID=945775 RepID=A0A2W4VXQ5_9CYAN|nr:MAG: hypothetical protein DCF19_18280 [Pseudanabaena frigida]
MYVINLLKIAAKKINEVLKLYPVKGTQPSYVYLNHPQGYQHASYRSWQPSEQLAFYFYH